MQADILRRFLTSRIIDIGPEDDRLTKLQAAATAVATSLQARPERVPQLTMVAVDPNVQAEEPGLNDVAAAVGESWATYRSVFSAPPVTIFRAVLLEALQQAQESNQAIAGAFALTATNLLPFLDVGREKPIWEDMLGRSQALTSEAARQHWSVEVTAGQTPKAAPAPGKPPKLDRKSLTTKLETAAGPHNDKNEALANGNPHWSNQGQAWVQFFVPRLSTAIAESVDGMADAVMAVRAQSDAAVLQNMTKFVEDVMPGFLRAGSAMQRRLDLLWWRQSKYSNAAARSYRSMAPEAAAVQMAIDFSLATPPYSVPSVEYFLREAMQELIDKPRARTGGVTLKQIAQSQDVRAQIHAGANPPALAGGPGRRPLISILLGADGDAEEALGAAANAKLGLDDVAVWVMREMHATAMVRGSGQA